MRSVFGLGIALAIFISLSSCVKGSKSKNEELEASNNLRKAANFNSNNSGQNAAGLSDFSAAQNSMVTVLGGRKLPFIFHGDTPYFSNNFHCYVNIGGEISCFGDGSFGRLGIPTPTPTAQTRMPRDWIPLPAPAIDATKSDRGACALLNDFSIHCWGGTASRSPTALDLSSLPSDVKPRSHLVSAIRVETRLAFIASDGFAYVGSSFNSNTQGFERVDPLGSDLVHLSIGDEKICAVNQSNVGLCVEHGETAVSQPFPGEKLSKLYTSYGGEAALLLDESEILLFRSERFNLPDKIVELQVEPTRNFGPGSTACVTLENGEVYCVGDNSQNALVGAPSELTQPTLVPFGEPALFAVGDGLSICGVFAPNRAKCVGHAPSAGIGPVAHVPPPLPADHPAFLQFPRSLRAFSDDFSSGNGNRLSDAYLGGAQIRRQNERAVGNSNGFSFAAINGIDLVDGKANASFDLRAAGSQAVSLTLRQTGTGLGGQFYGVQVIEERGTIAKIFARKNGRFYVLAARPIPYSNGQMQFLVAGAYLEFRVTDSEGNNEIVLSTFNNLIKNKGTAGFYFVGRGALLDNYSFCQNIAMFAHFPVLQRAAHEGAPSFPQAFTEDGAFSVKGNSDGVARIFGATPGINLARFNTPNSSSIPVEIQADIKLNGGAVGVTVENAPTSTANGVRGKFIIAQILIENGRRLFRLLRRLSGSWLLLSQSPISENQTESKIRLYRYNTTYTAALGDRVLGFANVSSITRGDSGIYAFGNSSSLDNVKVTATANDEPIPYEFDFANSDGPIFKAPWETLRSFFEIRQGRLFNAQANQFALARWSSNDHPTLRNLRMKATVQLAPSGTSTVGLFVRGSNRGFAGPFYLGYLIREGRNVTMNIARKDANGFSSITRPKRISGIDLSGDLDITLTANENTLTFTLGQGEGAVTVTANSPNRGGRYGVYFYNNTSSISRLEINEIF